MSRVQIIFPKSNTLEENAEIWAIRYNEMIEPGHGLFLNFYDTPKGFREFCINKLKKTGWILEKPFFIRKQSARNN